MSTHALGRKAERRAVRLTVSPHVMWLALGFVVAFLVPFLLTDVADINRDVFYGVYAAIVVGLLAAWARSTGYDLSGAIRRRWAWATVLGLACAAVLMVIVLRTDDATPRPHGADLVAAVFWRGIVYGITDGLLLSVFPILAVFAALAGTRLNERLRGKVVIGALALAVSLAMTAVYHVGYSDFRSEKLRKPMMGDLVWSVPTLVTLNPIGAPIAHVGLHVTAVFHSYDTEVFLPPHK